MVGGEVWGGATAVETDEEHEAKHRVYTVWCFKIFHGAVVKVQKEEEDKKKKKNLWRENIQWKTTHGSMKVHEIVELICTRTKGPHWLWLHRYRSSTSRYEGGLQFIHAIQWHQWVQNISESGRFGHLCLIIPKETHIYINTYTSTQRFDVHFAEKNNKNASCVYDWKRHRAERETNPPMLHNFTAWKNNQDKKIKKNTMKNHCQNELISQISKQKSGHCFTFS